MLSQDPWHLFSRLVSPFPSCWEHIHEKCPSTIEATVLGGAWDTHSPSLTPESLGSNQDVGKKHLSLASSGENSTMKFMSRAPHGIRLKLHTTQNHFLAILLIHFDPASFTSFFINHMHIPISGSTSRELSLIDSPWGSQSDPTKMFTSFLCSNSPLASYLTKGKKNPKSYHNLKDSPWSSPANFLICSLFLSPSSIPCLQMLCKLLSQACVLNFPPPRNLSP